MKKSILLLSSSYVHGSGFLESYKELLPGFLGGSTSMLFVPYAADKSEWDSYTQKVSHYFSKFGVTVTGIHKAQKESLFTDHKIIFIGGGNTFMLLHELQSQKLLPGIRSAVLSGQMKYIGSSAGTNVACKTICTTNDMPVIYPKDGFESLNLFPFQVNPHYLNPEINTTHMGETRDQRIDGYHQVNSAPVVGLREGAYMIINNDFPHTRELFIGGKPGAKIFFKGKKPVEASAGLTYILTRTSLSALQQ